LAEAVTSFAGPTRALSIRGFGEHRHSRIIRTGSHVSSTRDISELSAASPNPVVVVKPVSSSRDGLVFQLTRMQYYLAIDLWLLGFLFVLD